MRPDLEPNLPLCGYDELTRLHLPLASLLTEPTPADVDLLVATASPATMLILPKPSDPNAASCYKASPRVAFLRTTISEGGLGKVFEEAISHALKWKKACPTRRPTSWFGSTGAGRRNSGMSPPTSPSSSKPRSDRPIDVVLHYVYDQAPSPLTYPAAAPSAPSTRMSHRRTDSTQSVNLQGMLSAAFLVTTASLPFLAARSSAGLSSSASSAVRRPAPAVLSASSSRPSSSSSATSSRLPTSASTMHLTLSSASFAGRTLGDAPDAVLAHILPSDAPACLPQLLDGFVQTFLAANPSVLLAIVPSKVLAASPEYHEPDPSCPASHSSPPPSILQLLLASAVRPPLPPLPSLARSRRGSASSMHSLRSGTTASGLSTMSASRPVEGLLSFIGSPRAISFVPTALPTSSSAPSSAYPSPATPHLALTPPSPSTPTFGASSRPDAYGLPQSVPPVPDLIASTSSSSSASDDVHSLTPPSTAGRKALKNRGSFASLSTTSGAGSGERPAKSGGFWSRMFGRGKA